jgi:hypothetical protein
MVENEKLIIPTIHLNGTSKKELLEQQADAREAIMNAMMVLRKAVPHSHDYYPQGDGAYLKAAEQYGIQQKRLQDTYDELMQISLETDAQGSSR